MKCTIAMGGMESNKRKDLTMTQLVKRRQVQGRKGYSILNFSPSSVHPIPYFYFLGFYRKMYTKFMQVDCYLQLRSTGITCL